MNLLIQKLLCLGILLGCSFDLCISIHRFGKDLSCWFIDWPTIFVPGKEIQWLPLKTCLCRNSACYNTVLLILYLATAK